MPPHGGRIIRNCYSDATAFSAERATNSCSLSLANTGKRALAGRVIKQPARDVPSLADQGIDKHLAARARKAAAMPRDKFAASGVAAS